MKFTVALAVLVVVICSVTAELGVPDDRCPAEENESSNAVLIPHDTDCSKYLSCANGDSVEMQCPDDLLFNPHFKVCDWKENVKCDVEAPPA